jgi:hypothetical protein
MGTVIKQIDKEIKFVPFRGNITTYTFKYKFNNMPYLVADKFGNFFILEHCPNNRTIPFNILKIGDGHINYHGNQVRLSTLRKRAYKENSSYNKHN